MQVILRRKYLCAQKFVVELRVIKLNATFSSKQLVSLEKFPQQHDAFFSSNSIFEVCGSALRIPHFHRRMGIFPNLLNLSQALSRIVSKIHSSHNTITNYTLLLSELLTPPNAGRGGYQKEGKPTEGIFQVPSLLDAVDSDFILSWRDFFSQPSLKRAGSGLVLFQLNLELPFWNPIVFQP